MRLKNLKIKNHVEKMRLNIWSYNKEVTFIERRKFNYLYKK